MCFVPDKINNIIEIAIIFAFTLNNHVLSAANDTTYFQTRQLSGQQYGLEYNLQNYTNVDKISSRPRTLFNWNDPDILKEKTKDQIMKENGLEQKIKNQNTKKIELTEELSLQISKEKNKNVETERVENNVWWPWKNYDDWLNGRGLKAKQPTKKEKKTKKAKKGKKNTKKNEKKMKMPKNKKKTSKIIIENNNQLSINNDDNEIKKKGSIPEIRYKETAIDIILRNRSLVPTLVKYTSRNYTYDINECLINNGGCEGLCINTPGSYRCHCPPGFMVADTKCEDVDECLLRNGHGPCQGTCTNAWGGYKCSCHGIPGTKLAENGHTCDDVDECLEGTAGCSHQCINTVGSAFCVCPDGLRLGDDWTTCLDVDECSDPELQQPANQCADRGMTCLNTHGSYSCI